MKNKKKSAQQKRLERQGIKLWLYDQEGRLMMDGRDVCDCLDPQCPGCHFPCPRCQSEKCGDTCRCHRKTYYSEVEVEGANHKLQFPGQAPRPITVPHK